MISSFTDLFKEETSAGDIAVFTGVMGSEKDCDDECKKKKLLKKELKESAVGLVGRTGVADAANHVTASLRAEFKKIVKRLGGKTVARQLLAEMNAGGPLGESNVNCSKMISSLEVLYDNAPTKRVKDAVDELLDILDTDC